MGEIAWFENALGAFPPARPATRAISAATFNTLTGTSAGNYAAPTLAAASTLQKDVRGELKGTGNVTAAAAVGKAIAERAKAAGIKQVAFDRSGFKYHGRIKALADAARENGLEF